MAAPEKTLVARLAFELGSYLESRGKRLCKFVKLLS
jgi:hypothetical protein